MNTYDVSGEETLMHLRRLADLNGRQRTDYLDEIEHAHGHEYRVAVAREDMRLRDVVASKTQCTL